MLKILWTMKRSALYLDYMVEGIEVFTANVILNC